MRVTILAVCLLCVAPAAGAFPFFHGSYCAQFSVKHGGSNMLQADCKAKEKFAKQDLKKLRHLPRAVLKKCQAAGKTAGGSYAITDDCERKELIGVDWQR